MLRKVKTEVFYPYPPQQVWQVLTDRRALAAWLMENDFEPHVGHKFQFQTHTLPGLEQIIYCQVLELDAPKRLAFTWQDSFMHQPSIVTWILTPVDGGTQLQLEHRELGYDAIASAQPTISIPTRQSQFMHEPSAAMQVLAPIARQTSFPTSSSLTSEAIEHTLNRGRFNSHAYGKVSNFDKPGLATSAFTEASDSVILNSLLNGGWDDRLQQKLPQVIASCRQ